MKKVYLDIDEIPERLYQDILKEFQRQYGEGYYGDWIFSALKEEVEE